jgi:hypothetical protein
MRSVSSLCVPPRLAPTFDLACLCAACIQSQEDQQQKQKQQRRSPPDSQQLQALWRHFVEGACLSSSHERKALAIQLLQLLMPVMGPDMVPVLLSKQLLGCVATALKDKESYLHASAKRCLVSFAPFSPHNSPPCCAVLRKFDIACARLAHRHACLFLLS